jgi:hypothetical protein
MRNFSEADKKKKQARIQLEENPGNLPGELLSSLEDKVKAAQEDRYLSCPVAWKIAKESNAPRIAVGTIADRLGIRITNCQIGCFKVDKTIHDDLAHKKTDGTIIAMLETLENNNELTCAKVFELARQLKLTPMTIADVANLRNLKIQHCQLGCF